MAHQLYVLQVLTFNLLEERMMTKMDPNDQVKTHRKYWDVTYLKGLTFTSLQKNMSLIVAFQAQRDVIFELRRIAFDGENDPTGTEKRKAMYTKDYKMLGFTVSQAATLIKPPHGFVSHPWCFKCRTTSTRPWTSPKRLLGCWPWTTCCTWPRFTRTRISGLALAFFILTRWKTENIHSFISSITGW